MYRISYFDLYGDLYDNSFYVISGTKQLYVNRHINMIWILRRQTTIWVILNNVIVLVVPKNTGPALRVIICRTILWASTQTTTGDRRDSLWRFLSTNDF